jgi:hypothetical protein
VFSQDFILNGTGHGPVAEMLGGCHFDPNLFRPYLDERNRPCVTINTGHQRWDKERKVNVPVYQKMTVQEAQRAGIPLPPVTNTTMLRKQEWIQLDAQINRAARYRMKAWADLASSSNFSGFDGMGKLILEHETMSDPGFAQVDMDGLSDGPSDAPKFQLEGLPLPITHSDFWFSARRLAVSRNSGTPLDTVMAEAAGRRVAEMIEKMVIGNVASLQYGGTGDLSGGGAYSRTSKVYGYTNFPSRLTKTNLTTPTGSNPSATVGDVLAMRDQMYARKFYGPFMLYYSNDWDQYMDNDYILTGGNVATQTLRQRLQMIEGIVDVRRLDFLFSSIPSASLGPGGENVSGTNPFTLLMIQMTPEVVRAVTGMPLTVVQWEAKGGLKLSFKVMCIMVPQIRGDFYGNTGILHATTS